MPIRHLRCLLDPASVALIGASDRPGSLGAALTRNLLAGGFKGEVFPVNRRHRRVRDMPAYPHPSDLPSTPELAIIATPTPTVPDLLAELGHQGTKVAVIATPSQTQDTDEARIFHHALREAARPHGLRLLGPGSFGVIAPRCGLNASLGPICPKPGPLALIAPEGSLLTPIVEWATARGIGFSSIVALGERSDLDFGDWLDGLSQDPDTRAILLLLETVSQARTFLSAARAVARVKPVLVLHAGRGGDEASQLVDALYDAAFRRAGMLRVQSLRELFQAAEILALDLPVTGDRLAILGNGRGVGLLAADALLAEGGRLARLGPATERALRQVLPAGVAPANPLDLGLDADPARFAAALDVLLREPELDAILTWHAPNALAAATETAAAMIETVQRSRAGTRPGLLACWLGADGAQEARQRLLARGIPSYDAPDEAIRAFVRRWRHQRDQIRLMETPPAVPQLPGVDLALPRQTIQSALTAGRHELTPAETASLLTAYGMVLVPGGGTTRSPPPGSLLLALRMVDDPVFGPTLLFGPSGPAALDGELAAALPPLDLVLARAAIVPSRVGRLLQNAGVAADSLDAFALLLVEVAQLVADLGEVTALELNPVIITADGVTVGAARIDVAPFSGPAHRRLAIRPYPRELEETLPLPDGSTLLIRPVRPEDEPAFIAGFAQMSLEEVRMRFMHAVRELTHDEAVRLTRIDYDREMALVALRHWPDQPAEGCGVARFISEPDRERAEFAIILLRDATGIGLSSLLLRRLIQHARNEGIRELYGEILRENEPMLELCRAMGFAVEACPEDSGVRIATLRL